MMIVKVSLGSAALGNTEGYWKILYFNNIAALVREPEVSIISCEIFQILYTPVLQRSWKKKQKTNEHHLTVFVDRKIPSSS